MHADKSFSTSYSYKSVATNFEAIWASYVAIFVRAKTGYNLGVATYYIQSIAVTVLKKKDKCDGSKLEYRPDTQI